jgi:hypothetical protein
MGTFTSPRVSYGLQIVGTPTKPNSTNDISVGVGLTSEALVGNYKGYSARILMGVGTNATVDLTTNTWSSLTAGTKQVETATAAGTITASGNATVIVTGARITGSPVTVSVAVVNGDTAATWAAKVRTALAANTAIAALYDVGGSTTAITLTDKNAIYANDATLNISLANGTCTGITPATTSANTTSGVAGAVLDANSGDSKDFEGVTLGTILPKSVLIKSVTGDVQIFDSFSIFGALILSGEFALFKASSIADLSISSATTSTVEITVLGTF